MGKLCKDIKEKNSKGTNKKTVTVTEKSNKVIKSEPVKSVQKKKKESNITTKSKNIKKEVSKKNKLKTEKNASVKKVSDNKENTKIDEIVVIEKIKDFISKVVAMQDEAKKEITDKKPKDKNISQKQNKPKKEKTEYIIEYYDLPYRYNQTIVKILAQTPKKIFVYWDISDEDRMQYTTKYGNDFFNKTRPVLVVHNETMDYTFEVEINDFANSWYLQVSNPNCKYVIELGRRPNLYQTTIQEDYIYVTSSNHMEAPNDHILFEEFNPNVSYKNVKTGEISTKDFSHLSNFTNIQNIYGIYDLYKKIYKNELFDEIVEGNLSNSSSNSSSHS